MLIEGMYVPLTAPFYRDGRSYVRKLEHNVGRYALTPVAGMVALTGEGAALSDAETHATLDAIGKTAAAEKVLVAGIARESVRGALEIAAMAEAARFDAVLLRAPNDWARLRAEEVALHFRAVADASPLPVILWSDADCVLPVAMVAELAGHGNVIGLVDAGLTAARYRALAAATQPVRREVTVTTVFAPVTRRMQTPEAAGAATFVSADALSGGAAVAVAPPVAGVKMRTKAVGFQVLAAGAADGLVELLAAGVAGAMPALAACAPQGCYEAFAAWKDGDAALAAEKQQRLAAADALMAELGVAGVKYGCDLNGYYGGVPRLPRVALDAEARARVEKALAGLRN